MHLFLLIVGRAVNAVEQTSVASVVTTSPTPQRAISANQVMQQCATAMRRPTGASVEQEVKHLLRKFDIHVKAKTSGTNVEFAPLASRNQPVSTLTRMAWAPPPLSMTLSLIVFARSSL